MPITKIITGTKLPKQFLAFCTIGIANTAVDFIVFFLAIEWLTTDKIIANVLAWFIAVQLSYVMNSRFTFREPSHQLNLKALSKFMLSGLVGLFVSTISLLILSKFMDLMLAKLISIFIGLLFNFTLAKHFVFTGHSKNTL